MKEFQTVVQELLHNHERQRRYIALLTALCMVMAFTVSVILIEPAESMTGQLVCGMTEHIHSEDCFTYTCGLENDTDHVHSAECRKLTCGQTEHVHSENCYLHEDEQAAELMQINAPQTIENDMPEGDSPEGDEGISPQNGDVQVMDSGEEDDEYFKEVLENRPTDAVPFPDLHNVSVTVNEKAYKNGETIKTDLDELDNVKFYIEYALTKDSVSVDQPYIYYQLPAGIILPPNLCGITRYVSAEGYSGSAGYYSISESGLIVIRFTKKYIQEKIQNADGKVPGNIEFSGTIERDNTKSGDRNLQFGGENIVVEFPDKEGYDVSKSGKIVRPSTADQDIQIEWTIKLNSFDNTSFANGVVTDSKFAGVTDKSSIIIEPSNLGKWEGNEYHFNDDVQDSFNQVTFTYKETITKQEFKDRYEADYDYKESNTATLTVGESSYSDTDTVTFNETPSITKNYKADYLNKKGYNHKIDWSIVVEHPYGTSLSGYKVEDDALKNLDSTKITIKDKNGTILNSGSDYTFYSTTGTIEFKKDISQATITYTTDVEDKIGTVEIPNSAKLIPPTTDGKEFTSSVTAKYEDVQKLSDKKGNYNPDTKKITWSVGATVTEENSYYYYPDITLDGYTITDPAFEGLDFTKLSDSDIEAVYMESQWNGKKLGVSSRTNNEIVFDNGAKLTLNGNTITVSGAIGKFSFNYTTDYVEGTTETKTDGDVPYVENEITDKWGHKSVGKAEIVSRNETHKTLLNTPDLHYAGTGAEGSAITETLNWQIDLIKDEGFSGNDLRDAVSASVAGGNSATVTHYIDLNSIEVYYSTDGSDFTHQLGESYYTVNPSSGNDVTQFTLSFDEQVKSEGYHYIRVKYNSIVTMTPPEGGWKFDETTGKIIFNFDNTANGEKVDGNITVQDENHVDKTKIKVTKKWRDNGTESTTPPAGIDKVEFYIQRRSADKTNTWETYKNDGIWGNDENSKIYTLDSSNNWQETVENLPVETNDHSQKYYYRAVEVNIPEGYHVVSSTQDGTGVNSESEPFIITNEKNPTIKKEALDKDGNVIADGSEISTDKLAHLTYDGADCYEIKYKITLDNYSGLVDFTDDIPEGFSLAYSQETFTWGTQPDYQPTYGSDYSSGPFIGPDNSLSDHGHFSLNGNKATFRVNVGSYKYLYYNIVIPVSTLNGLLGSDGKLVANSISDGSVSASTQFTITAGTETPDVEDADLLKKTINNGTTDEKYNAFDGEISYSLYVNPEGKDISNSNEYDIHDVLSLIGLDSNSDPQEVMAKILAGNLKISVQEISNYSEDESGRITADVVRTLIPGEYSYNIDYLPSTTRIEYPEVNYSFGFANGDIWEKGGYWQTQDAKVGDKVTIIFHGNPNDNLNFEFKNGNLTIPVNQNYDEDGCIKITFTAVANQIYCNTTPANKIKSIEAEVIREEVITTIDSSADLTITVPDGMPLKITYSYTISESKEGTLKTGETVFTAKNEVSLRTKNVSSTDERTATFNYLYNDEAHIGVNNLPKLVKYNVGNQGESLSADFYIAVYDNGVWKFSNENNYTTEDNARKYEFNFSVSAIGKSIPEGAVPFQLDGSSNIENYLTLDTKKLYKLIEVKVPTDATNHKTSDAFEANDAAVRAIVVKTGEKKYDTLESLLKDYLAGLVSESSSYHNILTKFVSERYFRYTDADVKNPPSDYNSLNVTTVPKNGTLGIPNNELIDITAIKTWDNDVSNKGAVEFTLYWSYTKSNNGIPNDATKATASDLGLTAAFENPKTVAVSGTEQSCTWENLPNGKFNGTVDRPIYYYIKETKYTVGTETYKLDETDNKFYKLENVTPDTFADPKIEGAYQQFYTNNGINKSGDITVKNTKGLYVKKVWRTADNKALATDDIPVEYIKYVITGVGADGKRINIHEGKLTKENNWTEAVPPEELTGYTDFKVKEEIEEGQVEVLHGFNFSPNYNVTGSIGEITLVNKNNNPSVIDVTVNKEWSDGAENHTGNPIDIWLYRTSRYLTSEELETLKNTRTLSA